MPEIKAFRGSRYVSTIAGNPKKLVSPPYDVISEAARLRLYEQSPYNFCRVDYKKELGGQDIYAEGARELREWFQKGVVAHESEESLYVYRQNYKNLSGKAVERLGFISLMKINPALVRKHENTLEGPKEDRTRLLDAYQANMSPIFGMFVEKPGKVQALLKRIAKGKPDIDIVTDGVRQRLHVVSDKAVISAVTQTLKRNPIYIADGHHRFEVSTRYSLKLKEEGRPAGPADYVMTYLCDAERNDMTIYPTHRLLKELEGDWPQTLQKLVAKFFVPKPVKSLAALQTVMAKTNPKKSTALGLILSTQSGVKFVALLSKKPCRQPDVTLLHDSLVGPLLGGEAVSRSQKISFTRDAQEALKSVKTGNSQIAFLLNPMPIETLVKISDQGKLLPQKSTYFYPKLLSGLVFYSFESGRVL